MVPGRSSSWLATLLPVALALALAPAACGGGAGLAFDDLEGSTLSAACDFAVLCGSMPDRATCLASERTRESLFATMRTDIASGLVVYDSLAARRCVDDFGALRTCSLTTLASASKQLDADCGAVFKGTLATGQTCFFDEECAGQGTCALAQCGSNMACCAGLCTAKPAQIPVGGDCSMAPVQCVDGTTCAFNPQGTSPPLLCLATAGPGQACSPTTGCQSPYACVTAAGASGTCIAPSGSGQTCGAATTSFCDDGRESCDVTTNRCTPHIAVGGTCDASSAVSCVGYASCTGATCVALGGPGDSCDSTTGALSSCLGSLECDPATLRCTLPPAGASCR